MLKLSATRWFILASLLAAPLAGRAQTGGVRVGTPGAPDPSAVLDLRPDAATAPKGLLPPRLTTAQRDAIQNPAAGLTVFNTSTNALNVWNGINWVAYLNLAEPADFAYTGGPQTYTVPAGVTRLLVDMAGASGGARSTRGGSGGRVQATLAVTPGEVLTIYVGGAGAVNTGGYNGGGNTSSLEGGGGGATDVRRGGNALADRVLVAGGGGGKGTNNSGSGGEGGNGGGLVGASGAGGSTPGTYATGGGGGSQTAPGAGGTNYLGGPGQAGSGALGADGSDSGAGGGGYYGGGSGANGQYGAAGGGGGGSSYAGTSTSNVVHTQGYQSGNGYVSLRNADVPAPALDGRNFVNVSGTYDNLGNHTATQNLNLGANKLVGNGGSTGLSVASTGAVSLAAGLSLPIRTVNQVAGSYQGVTLTDADHTVRSGSPAGVNSGVQFGFFLPDPAGRTGRVYVLLNFGNTNANLYTATAANAADPTLVYDDASGAVTQVPKTSRMTLQSNGAIWLVLAR